MSDDYLWDGSGEPDREVQRLESLLRPLGHGGRAPELPQPRRSRFRTVASWAAAASVVLALWPVAIGHWGSPAGWDVAWIGPSTTGRMDPGASADRLGVGEWLETGVATRARLAVGDIGVVEIAPRTRVRLVDAGSERHRLSLARGLMHATIWAPPGRFVVDTPAATAVDLGCEYTLEVADDGAGLLSVLSGWVGFLHDGRESFVPAGAHCRTRPDVGPGTPFYADAPDAFKSALADLDAARDPAAHSAALARVLAAARARDAFSLWHLLVRGGLEDRSRVFDRLASLVPPPPGVDREGVLRGEKAALDQWWNLLGLEDVAWWRIWERPWAPPSRPE